MAPAAGVTDAAPIDALVPLGCGDQNIPGVRRGDCGPQPRQCVRVLLGLEAPLRDIRRESLGVASDRPRVSALVPELTARAEPELVAIALDHDLHPASIGEADAASDDRGAVLGGEPGDEVDAL